MRRLLLIIFLLAAASLARAQGATYADVHAVFAKNCLACHDAKEAEGGLVLETYESAMAGGDSGAAIVPGRADESLLVRAVEHKQKPFMPPPKKAEPLKADEVAVIRAWINAGATKPSAAEVALAASRPMVPRVAPKGTPRRAVQAMAYEPKAKLLAVARAGEVELRSVETQAVVRMLGPHAGHVNDVAFSADGRWLVAGAGRPGQGGEVKVWDVAGGLLVRSWAGHADAIYAIAVSPDGKTLATGGYDQKVILWDLASGSKLRELVGHNGAVYALAFRPGGQVLASASADRTVKLWSVADGKRLDTRPEPTREQQAIAFNADGSRLFAAGVDNRVRVWQVGPTAAEGSNPLLDAHFVHEGAVLRLALSADGKTIATAGDDLAVKLWDAGDFKQKRVLANQPDWPSALAFVDRDKALAVGRLDGSVALYDVATGKVVSPPKPELTSIEPRGVQLGHAVKVKLVGKNLAAAEGVVVSGKGVTARLLPEATSGLAWAEVTAGADASLGAVDVAVTSPGGNSGPQRLVVDDLPQVEATSPNHAESQATVATTLPVTFGGHFATRGEANYFAFDGHAKQTVVLDVGARRFGSKASVVLALVDPQGRTVATGEEVDGDPILAASLPADGRYVVRVTEQTGTASDEHFYRISAGDFALPTGTFPLAVPPGGESTVSLVGFNVGPDARVTVKAGGAGEVAIPVDAKRFRVRKPLTVMVGMASELVQRDGGATAMTLPVPGAVNSTLRPGSDGGGDTFVIDAKAGRRLALETLAARRGSPVDTRIEVLWPDGKPVQRVQLRAVRDSWLNFRGCDANQTGTRLQNWEEMDLNQFVYMSGEVTRLFRMPRGPDSDLLFFAGAGGKRRCYFGTTATSHALEEKAYVVEPHPVGEALPPNGLPVFPIYYANDDDELREWGTDSRLLFDPPKDGRYLVRVTDTRGFGGERYVYRLSAREAQPDFAAMIVGANPAVAPGTGRDFTVQLRRIDGFDGPVRVEATNVPPGFVVSTPIVVEAGQTEAKGTIFATAEAKSADPKLGPVKFTATAAVNGGSVTRAAGEVGPLTVAPASWATVKLEGESPVIELTPGQMTQAWLRVTRTKFDGRLTFDVENLPFGVIVADIGLNGVLIPEGQTERMIYLQCAPWVAETTRPVHARANELGNPTSAPVMVHVRAAK